MLCSLIDVEMELINSITSNIFDYVELLLEPWNGVVQPRLEIERIHHSVPSSSRYNGNKNELALINNWCCQGVVKFR